jgi:NarL family two-component system sensor histidine kinase YdfH
VGGVQGAQAIVEEEIERFTSATGIAVEADLASLSTLPAAVAEHAMRMITESLTNVARHARARHVWVQVSAPGEAIEVMVRDDGVGFDVAAAAGQAGHYGLLGLRERARLIGGILEVTSASGHGTAVRLTLPRADVPVPFAGQGGSRA